MRLRSLTIIILIIIIGHEAYISYGFYPYEPSYFNFLVGGSGNVAKKQLFDIEYWGSGTREAMVYLNSLHQPISVYSCLMRHLTMYYNAPTVQLLKSNPEYADYTIVPNSASWFLDPMRVSKEHQTLVYTVTRQGADLFYVYKNTARMGWRCGYETLTTYDHQTR